MKIERVLQALLLARHARRVIGKPDAEIQRNVERLEKEYKLLLKKK